MRKEIERKFIVNGDAYKSLAKGVLYRQGYIFSDKDKSVRVRVFNDKAILRLKERQREFRGWNTSMKFLWAKQMKYWNTCAKSPL